MGRLSEIAARGNRGHYYFGLRRLGGPIDPEVSNIITCKDGFTVSVIAGGGTYCTPKPTFCACYAGEPKFPSFSDEVDCEYHGPYWEVEVGFPSARPEPWGEWERYWDDAGSDPTQSVYSFVPIQLVYELIRRHGGEVGDQLEIDNIIDAEIVEE